MSELVVHDAERLKELQALPLERKILISQTRIIEWYQHWNGKVCVSFSGGKDSTVLLHLVRQLYPDVPVVFGNTGLEYPEIQRFARESGAEFMVPDMRFDQVIMKYGYPIISKEVSEAIYYARRIRSHNGNVEREDNEAKARELRGQRNSENEQNSGEKESKRSGTTENKKWQTNYTGNYKRATIMGEARFTWDTLVQTSVARNRRTILLGEWKGGTITNGEQEKDGNSKDSEPG